MNSKLESQTFLIIDCQTTGMRPSVGRLLEFAWGFASAESETFHIHSSLIRLPEGESIPPRVKEITGLKNSDLARARDLESLRTEFIESVELFKRETGQSPVALIHYAQFEEAWLKDLLRAEKLVDGELPFKVVCTHRISKKLFPHVPSRNIRGLTGFFGMRIGEIKRAAQHVLATQKIWTGIVAESSEKGLHSVEEIEAVLAQKPRKQKNGPNIKTPAVRYEYRVDRNQRLALPNKPGIYRLKSKAGEILYVGKATCLKDRVNSYFRGKKGRDPRKLELMAQVWDLDVVECESAVEAAVMESDEIKRLSPPYNVSLKEGNRALLYYDRQFETESLHQSTQHPLGPFRRFNAIDQLRIFAEGLCNDVIQNVFYQPIDDQVFEGGYELFAQKYPTFSPERISIRDHLAFGLKLLRASAKSAPTAIGEDVLIVESDELTPEDVAEKIERLYRQAAQTFLRAKKLTQLLWSDIAWSEKGELKRLSVRGGQINQDLKACPVDGEPLWNSLAIKDYDRMSVLLTEISKVAHTFTRSRMQVFALIFMLVFSIDSMSPLNLRLQTAALSAPFLIEAIDGVSYFDLEIHVGNKYLQSATNLPSSLEVMRAQSLGFVVGLGSPWLFPYGLTA